MSALRTNLALAAFGVILGLGLLEGAARLYGYLHRSSEFESIGDLQAMLDDGGAAPERDTRGNVSLRSILFAHPNEQMIFDLRPNLNVQFQGVPVTTNSCGLRSPELPVAKSSGVVRIALLGDSFAFGWGVRQEESFAAVLERELSTIIGPDRRVEVINLGVPGYSTFQEVARLEEIGLDFQPDLILVYFIVNDFGFPFYVRDVENPGRLVSSVRFLELLHRDKEPDMRAEKGRMQSYNPNRALQRLSDIAAARGIPVVVAMNPANKMKSQLKKLWVLKDNPSMKTVNFTREYQDFIKAHGLSGEELQLPTDPHPSAKKHLILGHLLASHLLPLI